MAAPRFLVVDCGAGHVACGVFTAAAGGRLLLQEFACEVNNPDPAAEASWAEQTGRAVGDLATRHKLSGICVATLPGHHTLTKFVRTPVVAVEKRAKIVEFEAQQAIPHALNEVVWDYVELADDGIDLEFMLAAVKRDVVEGIYGALETAGFSAERFTPSGLALQQAFAFCYPEVRESVMLVSVGARSTQVLFVERQHLFVRTLTLGGNSVTQHIADELKLDFAQAEALKLQVLTGRDTLPENSPSRAAVHQATQIFANRLQLELTRSSAVYRRHNPAAQPVAIYLTGGGAAIPDLPAQLAEKSKLRVERFDPLRNVEIGTRLSLATVRDQAQIMAELVGQASSLLSKDPLELNLLPPSVGAALAFRRRQPWLLAAAALVTCAPLPIIWHYTQVEQANLAQVQRIEAQIAPLRALANRNSSNQARIEEAKKQITAIQGIVVAKANWLAFLADLQGRLVKVDDVWLDGLHLVPLEENPDPSAAANAAPPPNPPAAADAGATPPATDAATVPVTPFRLKLSGRLVDRLNPLSKVSPESYAKVKTLLASFSGSPFIADVRDEKFDSAQPGILRFDCTLVISPKKPLL